MKIYKNNLDSTELEIAESLLFTGNGHIGARNTLEEQNYTHFTSNRHTYINGFYDTYPINYPEQYFGASTTGEQMLPVIDGSLSKIIIGDQAVDINVQAITETNRYLDLEAGLAVRTYLVEDSNGNKTKVSYERLASFVNKEQLITQYKFEKINHNLPIKVSTQIRFSIDQNVDKNDPRVAHNSFKLNILDNDIENQQVMFEVPNSKIKGYFKWDISDVINVTSNENGLEITSQVSEQYTKSYTYSLTDFVKPNVNFESLKISQLEYLNNFWNTSKVEIEAEVNIESSVNYGTFALLQSVGTKSIAAKGLSGIGYEGHVFWDAEMYVFPVFNKTMPSVAREMLMFRIKMLDKAIENRKLVGYPDGALYPWRTITGLESSSFFEAGMAQHHINVDITYALSKYIEQSGDYSILTDGGFDMMVEIGKMFASIMSRDEQGYHLDMVTGPDEYSALVCDNFYTNSLVQKHFENLLSYLELDLKLTLSSQLVTKFKDIADNIVLPFDQEQNIAKQDRDFLNKGRWPYEITGDKPLLLKYHPLEIYRHQISKQADVVLAMQLVGQELYDSQTISSTINYYDTVTTHDSSLSFSNFATVYARLGDQRAYEYFLKNARLDLDNLHHNTRDGIHTASMGGTYQTLIDGFSNYQIIDNQIVVENLLPKEIKRLSYKTIFRDQIYKIELVYGQTPKLIKLEK